MTPKRSQNDATITKNYTLTANDPKQQIWGISGGLLSGGLESGGLESGGLESGGLDFPSTDFGSGLPLTCP